MTSNMIRILGIIGAGLGLAATALSDWVDDKKMDQKIEEKVNEALAQRENEEDEES